MSDEYSPNDETQFLNLNDFVQIQNHARELYSAVSKSQKRQQPGSISNSDIFNKTSSEKCFRSFKPLKKDKKEIQKKSRIMSIKEKVYEKLCKKENKELLCISKTLMDKKETEECTFIPKISVKNKRDKNKTQPSSVFLRLNKERNGKQRIDNYIKTIQSEEEMKKCSFHPSVNSRLSNSNSISTDSIHHKLHFDYKLKEIKMAKRLVEKNVEEFKEYSFVPSINGPINDDSKEDKDQIFERLHNSKNEKHTKLLKKKYELIEAEKKMINDIQKFRSNKYNCTNLVSEVDSSNVVNRLYVNPEEAKRKKKAIVNKILIETGCIFSPKINQINSCNNNMRKPISFSFRKDKEH